MMNVRIGTPAETVLGDITGDSAVGIEDVQIALKSYTAMVAGLPETLTAAQKKAGDITGDGTVSADDVQLMLKYYTENTVAGKKLTWADLQKKLICIMKHRDPRIPVLLLIWYRCARTSVSAG